MSEKAKRVPSRATLEARVYKRVIDAEERVARVEAAWDKARTKHKLAVVESGHELAEAQAAFAKFSEPVPEADDAES